VKIGVKLPTSGPFATAEKIHATAVECDRLGYDSLWVHDHVHRTVAEVTAHFVAGSPKAWASWGNAIEPNMFESLTTLFYVAGCTTNVQLGTSIVVAPMRNPVWLAKQIACLDHFTGGRVILGIGSGGGATVQRELDAIGLPELGPPRGRVVDEWVAIMRRAWEDPVVDYEGEFLQIKGAEVYPKPLQKRMPIWYGGNGRRASERIAKSLDGWLPMFKSPNDLRRDADLIMERAVEFGRDPSEITLASEHWMAIDDDARSAIKRVEDTHRGMMSFDGSFRTADYKLVAEGEQLNLVGAPDTILDLLTQYREVGVEHVVLRIVADDFAQMLDQLAMFKEHVKDRLPAASRSSAQARPE
jgi:probable F420-dependent oxidoreductase